MTDEPGLIAAYIFDGNGGGAQVDWDAIRRWTPEAGTIWIHLNRKSEEAQMWLTEESGLDEVVCEALLDEETRPRSASIGGGLLVILRGVNLNPGADPEDMISVRVWIDRQRIISLRYHKIMAIQDVYDALASGTGPASTGEFVALLTEALADQMEPILGRLREDVDDLEERVLEDRSADVRTDLSDLRRRTIIFHRYISPQRDMMHRLQHELLPFFDESNRVSLREAAQSYTRFVEDLNASRERTAIIQEHIDAHFAERMHRTMYLMSIVAALFLPLGLLTGLLGINVGGIPGSDSPWAFPIVCGILALLAAFQVWLFRRLRFF